MIDPRPDIYGGKDPRQLPIYSVSEVAHHLRLPRTTVQSWVRSRGGPAPFARVIVPDDKGPGQRLSFRNLVEFHVLSSLRGYDIPMPRVREAIGFMRDLFATDHPLADIQIHTDRAEIFVKYFGAIVTVSRGGQTALGPVVEQYLERIERDKAGLLQRLYPFVKDHDTARAVAMDPRRKFGRPYLVDVGVETSVIAGRYRAGEKIAAIAADFDTTKDLIEGALRFEQALQNAA